MNLPRFHTIPIQATYQSWMKYLKTSRFWLAIVFGVSFGLLLCQYILSKLWSLESLRLRVTLYLFIVLFFLICFWFLDRVGVPRFQLMTKMQRSGVIFVSVFMIPAVLIAAVLNPNELLKEYVYFLLPDHTVEVRVEAPHSDVAPKTDIVLTGFYTDAQGYMSFNSMEVNGWKRVGDKLVLIDPVENRIKWQGKTGEKAGLVFMSHTAGARAMVSWDNADLMHDLSSATGDEARISKKFEIPFYAGAFVLILSIYLCIIFLSFCLSVYMTSFPGFASHNSVSKGAWLVHALPMWLIWTVYLLTFWPGFMSPDSMSQWSQVVTGKFVHANPVGHTLTMWLITRLWFSPAAVALVQIAALGAVLGWGITTMREFGAPSWLAWLTTIALALSPANSALSITIWKDILFSTVVVAFTILILKIVMTQGKWLDQKTAWAFLGSISVLVSLYRLNGFFVIASMLTLIAYIYRKYWKSLLKAVGLFLIVYYSFTGIVFRMLNVKVVDMARDELVIAQLLAGHMQAGTYFSAEDQVLLTPVMPEYPWPYNCYRNSALIFTLDRRYMVAHSSEISALALKVTQRNPLETLEHFACQGASVYRVPQEYRNEMGMFGITENDYGIKQTPLLHGFYPVLSNLLTWITEFDHRSIIQFVWRMPFWMYFGVYACILFCIRNRTWKPLLILLPGLITVMPYLILTLGQIFRYVYSMYLIGILLGGYFLLCKVPDKIQHQVGIENEHTRLQ